MLITVQVAANCPRSGPATMRRRAGSNATTASSVVGSDSASTFRSPRNSAIASDLPAPALLSIKPPSRVQKTLIYDFEPSTELELAVSTGDIVDLVEPDQEGWTKVRRADGTEGLVPTSYLGSSTVVSEDWQPILTDFETTGDGELTVVVGEEAIVLAEQGGGWVSVKKRDGSTGLVPAWAVRSS